MVACCRVLGKNLESKMKKIIATAAITAALTVPVPASAQAVSLATLLQNITAACGATATLTTCDALVAQYIEQTASLPAAERASAIGQIVVAATTALRTSAGTNATVAAEIQQIVGSATTALDTVSGADTAVNSALANVTVAVLEVVEARDLQDDAGAAATIVSALEDVADSSSDSIQASAIDDIAAIIEVGGSVVDVIEEMDIVSSYASPA